MKIIGILLKAGHKKFDLQKNVFHALSMDAQRFSVGCCTDVVIAVVAWDRQVVTTSCLV